jgi:hypothetical protein
MMEQTYLLNKKIKTLEEEIEHLKEYLLSDCCRQCVDIISKIDKYQIEITELKTKLENYIL